MNIINNFFKTDEYKTSIKTELLAGITTFFTMSYLLVLSPKLMSAAGLDFNITLFGTVLLIFIGSTFMGLYANKPYAVAPFIGETAFISYTLCCGLGINISSCLGAVFISGFLLLVMSLFNIRTYIINQIPETIKLAFCSGLGLFFIFISLKDIGIIKYTTGTVPLQFGNVSSIPLLLALLNFILMVTLTKKGVKCALVFSIILTTLLSVIFGVIELPRNFMSIPVFNLNMFENIDFSSIFNINFLPILFVIFMLVNIDTSGALIALNYNENTKNIKDNNLKKSMITDSIMVILAPLFGTTTPGAYIDSMTGIKAGGRTGLCAITTGFLFLLGIPFSPLISIIPPCAYAPALLFVGIILTSVIKKIDFDDISECSAALFIIGAMIFSYNIGSGIILGFIIYPLIQLLSGNKNKTNITLWILFVLSVIYFIIYPY